MNRFKLALSEDLGSGDLTTQALIPRDRRGKAEIRAKASGVLCGGPVVKQVFRLRDRRVQVTLHRREGGRIRKGDRVVTIQGRIRAILEAERTALNFLGRLSGIATLTRQYVERVEGTGAKIFDTRKTTPLWRDLEKYAVRCGGGENHRFGLWDEVLVKENHWAAIHDLLEATRCRYFYDRLAGASLMPIRLPGRLQGKLRRRRRTVAVQVEVRNLKELVHLLEGPFVPDRILLDNFPLAELRRAVLFVKGLDLVLRTRYHWKRTMPLLEASGGITLENVRAVAQTGVDRISVGRLTHSTHSLDYSLEIVT